MVKSKIKIKKQIKKKTDSELVQTINSAMKHPKWKVVAEVLSGPRKKRVNLNIGELNEKIKGDKVVIPGKVLSQGDLNKKIEIGALGFSEKARDKLLKAGCKIFSITDEIKKNPEAKGVEILK